MVFDQTEILQAFAEDEFFPVFQPLVELRTGQVTGFEILARWNSPRHGAIPPDRFVPVLERDGLIDQLSHTLMQKAFTHPAISKGSFQLAINISPQQMLRDAFPQRIAAIAEQTCFPLHRLTIEITESALLDDLDRARTVARELKALRCKLALDDFGTGYSSLKHLHTLPFDEIKVDRSFVSSLLEKRESRKIIAAMLGLGQSLGLSTVAEGVETQEQANMLLRLGCDHGQGWLFGSPAPITEIDNCLKIVWHADSPTLPVGPTAASLMNLDALPAERLALLQAIYDGAPVGLCFLDRKMRYVSLNRRLAEINGVSIEGHLGKTVPEVIPQVFPSVENYIRRALQGEAINGVEVERMRYDTGAPQSLVLSYHPARDEAGEILGVSVAIMDISDGKRTEAALRESEARYRHMMQLSPHVPWVLDAKGEVAEASARWEQYTGQPLEEALGTGWLKMLHPEDIAHTLEAIQTSLATGQSIDIEYRVHTPRGQWLWMRSRGAPRFGPSGKIMCIYGVVEEVHGHKNATEELESVQAALRTALDSAPLGMVIVDGQDCTVRMMNQAARTIFGAAVNPGMTLAEYTRMAVTSLDGRRIRPEDFPITRSILRGEVVNAMQVLLHRADGVQLWLSISSKPIYAEDGELIGGLSVIRNLESDRARCHHPPDSPASTLQ